MAAITYHARQCDFKYTTAVTLASSTDIPGAFSAGTSFAGVIKDVTITEPEGDVEIVNFLGEDSGGYQNAKFEEKAFTEASIEGTLVVDSADVLESIAFGSGNTAGSYTNYGVGDGNRVTDGAILAHLDNGTNEYGAVLNNLRITKYGDITPTGTDGHWEMSFTAKCLPADFKIFRL